MRNLLITLRFCGASYHGFQVQKNATTITQVFQDAVEEVLGKRYDIKGCSRTDAGVHANRYCISMKVDDSQTIPCQGLVRGLNAHLPGDVAVLDCREVEEDFHARYSCVGKRYVYKFHNADLRDPFLKGRVYHCQSGIPLDAAAMDRAARHFLGSHDFSAFCAAGGSVEDKVRTIYGAAVERQGDMVLFSVTGSGFLYNMVRIMAGTLLAVGQHRLDPDTIPAIIESMDRNRAGLTLPAAGLYLDEIFYCEEERNACCKQGGAPL